MFDKFKHRFSSNQFQTIFKLVNNSHSGLAKLTRTVHIMIVA